MNHNNDGSTHEELVNNLKRERQRTSPCAQLLPPPGNNLIKSKEVFEAMLAVPPAPTPLLCLKLICDTPNQEHSSTHAGLIATFSQVDRSEFVAASGASAFQGTCAEIPLFDLAFQTSPSALVARPRYPPLICMSSLWRHCKLHQVHLVARRSTPLGSTGNVCLDVGCGSGYLTVRAASIQEINGCE
jgi:hypothetical protein